MISFIEGSSYTKYIICSDKKQSSGYLGGCKETKGAQGNLGIMDDIFIILIVVMASWVYRYVKLPNCALNM